MTELGILDPPHVLPLMDFVRRLRAQGLPMPSVDPNDGGIFAKVLFLQMTAGPIAVGTGIISQDNNDPTAHNMKRTLGETGFLRSNVVLWKCRSVLHQHNQAESDSDRCPNKTGNSLYPSVC
jgi:hypothetical protein